LAEDGSVARSGDPGPSFPEPGDIPMKRIFFFVAALATVMGVAACPESNPSNPGGTGGSGGQGATGGTGGSAGTGGAASTGGRGGTGGTRPPDTRRDTPAARPDGPARRDSASTSDGAATAGACGFSRCPAGTTCCDQSCGVCAPTCPQQPPRTCGGCTVDNDCRLFDDYCTGCDCRGLNKADPNPVCNTPGVMCIRQPCGLKVALCRNGRCIAQDVPL
jgi:hypothetical protein